MALKSEFDHALADAKDYERTKNALLARRWIRRANNAAEEAAVAALKAMVAKGELPDPEIPPIENSDA
jgi:hypothetical protein